MCIFAQPVVSVTDTSIFARLLPDGQQALVYQMEFESTKRNAIILPLPVGLPANEEDSLEFISLKGYGNFFKDLNRAFPLLTVRGPSEMARGSVYSRVKPELVVHDVGDFVASFVPSQADFGRLDKQFQLPKESWDKIPKYADYGFAVFQLKKLSGKPHPMAFKFRSRFATGDKKSIFFPTVHIHDGKVHRREKFDHTLFLQAPQYDDACGDYHRGRKLVPDLSTGYVRSIGPAKQYCQIEKSNGLLAGEQLLHRLEMVGRFANEDVLANLAVSKKNVGFKPKSFLKSSMFAVACGMAGLSWFCDRRTAVQRKEQTSSDT